MPKYSKKAQDKVERAMHERKRGQLKSGGSGKTVTSRKQAIAIGLSEARAEGAKVPKKSSGGRKSASGRKKSAVSSRSGSKSTSTRGKSTTRGRKSSSKTASRTQTLARKSTGGRRKSARRKSTSM